MCSLPRIRKRWTKPQTRSWSIPHRKDFALNDLVMVVPSDSKLNLNGAKDLAKPEVKRIAVGNPDSVPAGRYTKAALTTAGLWETLQPKYVFGASVRQALDYVGRGEVDAGFVYRTDAKQGGDKMKVAAVMDGHKPVLYPIAVATTGSNRDGGAKFVGFVLSPEGQADACQVWLQQPAEVVAYTCGREGEPFFRKVPLPSPPPSSLPIPRLSTLSNPCSQSFFLCFPSNDVG